MDSNGKNIALGEGRVYGARYLTVRPEICWDLESGDWGNLETWPKMIKWCGETFGPTPEDGVWTPNARWYVNDSKFWFRSQLDLTLFLLMWA